MNNQFKVDVPRIELYINNNIKPVNTQNPERVWETLFEFLDKDKEAMRKLSYYCTQACLGDMYIDETFMLEEGETILSSPKHTVVITIKNKHNWMVEVARDFRLAYLSETCGETWDLDMVKFKITYNFSTNEERTNIDYTLNGVSKMGKSDILEKENLF